MSTTSKIQILIEAIDKASSVLGKVGTSVGGLSKKLGTLGDTAKLAAGVLLGELAHDALGALTKAAGEASEGFMDYEQTLTKIVSATNKTGDAALELEKALALVSESQTDLGYSAADAAKALEALVKAGMSGEDAASALRSALSLARLEGIRTDEAAGLLVQTLTMFGLKAEDSTDALDLLSKAADAGIDTATGYASGLANAGAAAHNMGLSLDETLAALVQLDKTYGSATESGTYLNAMFKDLVNKSDDLGISLYNQDGTMKSLSEIIEQLRGKVQSFGDDQEAVNKYLSVFDVRAQRAVIGLLNYDGSIADTVDSMQDARSVQEKMNMIMDTTAGKTAAAEAEIENASYALGEMTSNMTLAWKQFALGLGPIGAVADALGPSLLQGAMTGFMVMLPTVISSMGGLSGAMSAVGAAANLMLGPIGLVIAAIALLATAYATNFMGFKDVVDSTIGAITNTLSGFADWFTKAWGNLVQGATTAWNNFWTGAQQFVNDPVGTITSTVQNLADNMQSRFQEVYDETGNIWKSTWESLKTIPVIGDILGAVEGLANSILSIFGVNMDDVFNIWQGAWQSIQNFIADPIGSIEQGVTGLMDNMQSSFQQNLEETGNVWRSTWESLKTIPVLGDILGAVEGLGNQILGIFGLSMDDVFNVWQGAWESIQNFINDPIGSITSAVTSFGQTILDTLTGVLNSISAGWENIWNGISTFFSNFISSIQSGIGQFGDWLVSSFTGLGETLTSAWNNIWTGIQDVVVNLIHDAASWGTDLVNNIVNGITGLASSMGDAANALAGAFTQNFMSFLSMCVDWGRTLVKNIANGIRVLVDMVGGAARQVGEAIQNAIWNFCNAATNWGSDLTRNLSWGISGAVSKVVQAAVDIGTAARDAIWNFVNAAWNWGSNLIKNFVDGIKSAMEAVADTVSDIAGTIASWLGIGSPAETGPLHDLMKWGPNLTESFAEGILSGLPKVEQAAERVAGVFDGFGTFKGGFAGTGGTSVQVNISAPLVNVQGSADRKTAEYAADLVRRRLQTVLIESSSSAAPTKRIRTVL